MKPLPIPTLPISIMQLLSTYTLNISPKVGVPGFVGLFCVATYCELHHYIANIDFGSVLLGIVSIMIGIGWLVPTGQVAVKTPGGVPDERTNG